jgi:hypothetical protein
VLSLHNLPPETVADFLREREPGPEEMLLRRKRAGYLRDAIAAWPDRPRTVVIHYFLLEQPMAEIAVELAVTSSRLSQLRADALTPLRDGMNARLDARYGSPAKPRTASTTAEMWPSMSSENLGTRPPVTGRRVQHCEWSFHGSRSWHSGLRDVGDEVARLNQVGIDR